jgi:hypothetical protein
VAAQAADTAFSIADPGPRRDALLRLGCALAALGLRDEAAELLPALPDGGARARLRVALHPDDPQALHRAAAELSAPGRWRPCGDGWLRRDDARAELGDLACDV